MAQSTIMHSRRLHRASRGCEGEVEGGARGPSGPRKYTPGIDMLVPSKFHAERPTFVLRVFERVQASSN